MSKPSGGKVAFGGVTAAVILSIALLLPNQEGRPLKSYWDGIGQVWTACAGVTGPHIGPNMTFTETECLELETAYIAKMYARMGRCVKGEFALPVVKAFGHFAYNIGEDKFCGSTAARLLNEGRVADACKQILRWRFAGGRDCFLAENARFCGGIKKRRTEEYQWCMEGV